MPLCNPQSRGWKNAFPKKIWNNDACTQASVAAVRTGMVSVSQTGEKVHLTQRKQAKQSLASL
jgi:hypothetical protein